MVSSDEVTKPAAVRFAWHQEAQLNLMNAEGLPIIHTCHKVLYPKKAVKKRVEKEGSASKNGAEWCRSFLKPKSD
jgi:hypothetical protein